MNDNNNNAIETSYMLLPPDLRLNRLIQDYESYIDLKVLLKSDVKLQRWFESVPDFGLQHERYWLGEDDDKRRLSIELSKFLLSPYPDGHIYLIKDGKEIRLGHEDKDLILSYKIDDKNYFSPLIQNFVRKFGKYGQHNFVKLFLTEAVKLKSFFGWHTHKLQKIIYDMLVDDFYYEKKFDGTKTKVFLNNCVTCGNEPKWQEKQNKTLKFCSKNCQQLYYE